MQSTPHLTVQRLLSGLRRHWRIATGVAAALLIVTTIVQPWHDAAPTETRSTADRTTSSSAPDPADVSGGTKAPESSPTPKQKKSSPKPTPRPANPNAPLDVRVSSSLRVSGTTPNMPWPSTGQAAISLSGAEPLGVSGRQVAVPTASMAKAMTAYIVLRDHPLKAGEDGPTIRVTRAEAAQLGYERSTAQATIPVEAGEKLTQRQAMNALLLKSANNVARILARWDAGSVDRFLGKMNATADRLGMDDTHYTDPSGWHATTKSTVTDQIKLAEAAMKRKDFAGIVSTRSAWVPLAGWVRNVNQLLGEDGIVGIKTGSMSAAGGCLLFAAKATVKGKNVYILGTVMDQRSSAIGDLHQAFASSRRLVERMHEVIGSHTVVKAGQTVATVPGGKGRLVAAKSITVAGWSGMKYHRIVKATVAKNAKSGASVGTVTVNGVSVPVTYQP